MALSSALPVDQLAAQASAARPGRAVLTAIAAVFTAIGWIAGRVVAVLVFAGLAIRFGYRMGRVLGPAPDAAQAAQAT